MKGWKTWVAVVALAALGLVDIGNNDVQAGVEKLTAALALVGIGHKIERGLIRNSQSGV